MRGLTNLNAKLAPIGYELKKHIVRTYILKGRDGTEIKFNTKNEALAYIEKNGEKLLHDVGTNVR